ncbi:MAG: T9SS type A sorting domain-containing protein [Cryomorphaceae bacterium]
MKNSFVLIILAVLANIGLSQTAHYFTDPEVVAHASEFGNIRPHIVSFEDGVGVIWSKANGNLYFSYKHGDGDFSDPFKLNQSVGNVFAASYGGADIAAQGDELIATFMTTPFLEAKVYWTHSTDRGATWSSPALLDLPDSIIPFLPTIAIDQAGDPSILTMAYDSNYANPQYAVVRSDNGTWFSELIDISAEAPHEVCDCCPAHILSGEGADVALFRNNDNNIRDIWYASLAAESNQADTVFDIDPSDWFIQGCPSTGPDGAYTSSGIHTVWMSSASGVGQVLISSIDTESHAATSAYLHLTEHDQYTPRIAASGDTIGVMFEQIDSPVITSVLMYSVDGGETFSEPIDIVGDSARIYNAPDIAFSKGGFDLVYRDIFDGTMQYKRMEFGFPVSSGLELPNPTISIYPNPSGQLIYLSGIDGSVDAALYDVRFQSVGEVNGLVKGKGIDVSHLESGVYFVTLKSPHFTKAIRFVKH